MPRKHRRGSDRNQSSKTSTTNTRPQAPLHLRPTHQQNLGAKPQVISPAHGQAWDRMLYEQMLTRPEALAKQEQQVRHGTTRRKNKKSQEQRSLKNKKSQEKEFSRTSRTQRLLCSEKLCQLSAARHVKTDHLHCCAPAC